MTRVQQVGDQIEELLGRLGASGQGAAAEELVRLLVSLYGDGLEHIMAVLADDELATDGATRAAMAATLDRLISDPLVESLLLLHGLHPLDVDARIQRALDQVRPYLGSHAGGVHYVGVSDGVARLRLEGNCDGCPSSAVTVQLAIEGAVQDAAPEVTEVVVEGVTEAPAPPGPVLLQIGPRPDAVALADAGPDAAAAAGSCWPRSGRRVPGPSPPPRPTCRSCSARSAGPCTPTGMGVRPAAPAWATAGSIARC